TASRRPCYARRRACSSARRRARPQGRSHRQPHARPVSHGVAVLERWTEFPHLRGRDQHALREPVAWRGQPDGFDVTLLVDEEIDGTDQVLGYALGVVFGHRWTHADWRNARPVRR